MPTVWNSLARGVLSKTTFNHLLSEAVRELYSPTQNANELKIAISTEQDTYAASFAGEV